MGISIDNHILVQHSNPSSNLVFIDVSRDILYFSEKDAEF